MGSICRHCADHGLRRDYYYRDGQSELMKCDRCPRCEHCRMVVSKMMDSSRVLRSIPDEDGDHIWFCNDGQVGLWIIDHIRTDHHRDTLDVLCRLFAGWMLYGDILSRPDVTLNLATYVHDVSSAAILEAQHAVDDRDGVEGSG